MGVFWPLGRRERTTKRKARSKNAVFLNCFCMRFLTACVCVLFASALAGAKAQLKNMLKTIGFYDIICVCAVCARSANILQTERKSNKQLSKCKPKTSCHGSSKKVQKSTVLGAKMAPKIDPGGLRERLGQLLRATCAPRTFQKRSWRALKKAFKTKEKLETTFCQKLAKKWLRGGDPDLGGSAEEAGPVKALPGG